jgi:hypothetical protein
VLIAGVTDGPRTIAQVAIRSYHVLEQQGATDNGRRGRRAFVVDISLDLARPRLRLRFDAKCLAIRLMPLAADQRTPLIADLDDARHASPHFSDTRYHCVSLNRLNGMIRD